MSETTTLRRSARAATLGLASAFDKGRPALIGYVMGGYPDRERSLEALRVLAQEGVDLIELGVPYGDPLADGSVICAAAEAAREANPGGFGLAETIDLAGEFIACMRGSAPAVALMTYLNPVMRLGMADVASAMRGAGIAGVIIPDLPPEMAAPWLAVSRGIDTVFLAAPTSTSERLSKIGEASRGFVYCVSTAGVTGERSQLPTELADYVARVKAATTLPVAVGFGVSTAEQTAEVARFADGVVVGSAIVRRQDDLPALREFVRGLVRAVG